MASSSATTIEMELQPVQEKNPNRNESIIQPKQQNHQIFQTAASTSMPMMNREGQEPDLELPSSGLQRDEQEAVIVAHALEKWNDPAVNVYRLFATFWSFVIMGANDAAYGVSTASSPELPSNV